MPTYKTREVRKALTSKLKCRAVERSKHTRFEVFDEDGTYLCQTFMSRGNKDIRVDIQSEMAGQLKVTKETFRGLVDCSVNRAAYLAEAKR